MPVPICRSLKRQVRIAHGAYDRAVLDPLARGRPGRRGERPLSRLRGSYFFFRASCGRRRESFLGPPRIDTVSGSADLRHISNDLGPTTTAQAVSVHHLPFDRFPGVRPPPSFRGEAGAGVENAGTCGLSWNRLRIGWQRRSHRCAHSDRTVACLKPLCGLTEASTIRDPARPWRRNADTGKAPPAGRSRERSSARIATDGSSRNAAVKSIERSVRS